MELNNFPYGSDSLVDDAALLLNNLGARCAGCERVTKHAFLEDKKCPICRGLTLNNVALSMASNGGVACDVRSGPCSCGAWH